MSAWVPSLLMVVLMVLNVPIAFAIALSALSFFLLQTGLPLEIFVQKMVSATDSYPLLAVPFFVLMGALMNAAGITRRLLTLADALVGHLTGALAQMCTVLATLLGGLTASSTADAAMLSKTLGVEMIRRGFFISPFEKIYLSIMHSDEDLDRMLEAAREVLRDKIRPL